MEHHAEIRFMFSRIHTSHIVRQTNKHQIHTKTPGERAEQSKKNCYFDIFRNRLNVECVLLRLSVCNKQRKSRNCCSEHTENSIFEGRKNYTDKRNSSTVISFCTQFLCIAMYGISFVEFFIGEKMDKTSQFKMNVIQININPICH